MTRPEEEPTKPKWWRIAILAALLIGLFILADRTGLRDSIDQESVRTLVAEAGVLGMVAYVGAFAIGQLLQLPGIVFVLAAGVAYGPVVGFAVAYAGALAAVSTTFFVVRAVGGKPLGAVKNRFARKILARLEDRPILTIVALRSAFALSPPLSYALAMSKVRFREYFAGSAVGLIAPIAVWLFLSEQLLEVTACLF